MYCVKRFILLQILTPYSLLYLIKTLLRHRGWHFEFHNCVSDLSAHRAENKYNDSTEQMGHLYERRDESGFWVTKLS